MRVSERMGEGYLPKLASMFVGTIHAYCFRLLQEQVPRYADYDVLDEHAHAAFLSRHHASLGLKNIGKGHWDGIGTWNKTLEVIGNELLDSSCLSGAAREVYAKYVETLERYRLLTYSRIITEALSALNDPKTYERVRSGLRYLFVDEYQDINPAQQELIRQLSRSPVELSVVGDDDQAIYQWRGSKVEHMLQFSGFRPAARTLPLSVNRRSRPRIISVANEFAQTIEHRLAKTMDPHRDQTADSVQLWSSNTPLDEARLIAETIENLHDQGIPYSDVGVLFRSVKTSAPPLLRALHERGIPFSAGGRTGLFVHSQAHALAKVFALLAGWDWKSSKFGESESVNAENIAADLCESFPDPPPSTDVARFLRDWRSLLAHARRKIDVVGEYYHLLDFLNVQSFDPRSPQGSMALGILGRFATILADFESVNRRGQYDRATGQYKTGQPKGVSYYRQLTNYLLHYARDNYEDFDPGESAASNAVQILTIHQAKGLEWPVVFLPSMQDSRFPSRNTGKAEKWLVDDAVLTPGTRQRYQGTEEDERRLFYVAVTRARDALYISHFRKQKNASRASRFLSDLKIQKVEDPDSLPIPDIIAGGNRETAPVNVSYSDVASYQECGHKFRHSYVWGFKPQVQLELGYGKAVHQVLRIVAEETQERGEVPDRSEAEELVAGSFYVPYASAPAFQRMKASAIALVDRYLRSYEDDLRRVWAVERAFELHVAEGILSGRADIILDRHEGEADSLSIVDYKVRSGPEHEHRYKDQLAVYSHVGRGEGLDVRAAYLHDLQESARENVDISEAQTEAAVGRAKQAMAGIRDQSYAPTRNSETCAKCDFRRICRYARNT